MENRNGYALNSIERLLSWEYVIMIHEHNILPALWHMESNRHQGDVHMSPFPFEYYKFGWQSAIINKVPFTLPFLTLRFLHESEASSFDLMKTSMILLMLSHYLPTDSQHSSLYKNLVLISTTHCVMLTFIASPTTQDVRSTYMEAISERSNEGIMRFGYISLVFFVFFIFEGWVYACCCLSLELVVSPPCHFLFAIIVGGLSLFQLLL
jgi:hypothetical protein